VEIIVEKINFHDIAWKKFKEAMYRGHIVFFIYISHYSVTEINPFHGGSVAENTTEQVN
jgi:hypothetical protein